MHNPLEEILEAIWVAEEFGESSLQAIQAHCPIPVSQDDLALLARRGRVDTGQAGSIRLTDTGRAEARGVIRRHRLASTLFATILDMDPVKREEVACEAEHVLLPEVEESICTLLGHPHLTPDGKPIPPGACCTSHRTSAATVIVNLPDLAPGERGRVTFIKPKHHHRLHRLNSFGLIPGTIVEVHQRSPAFCIRYEGTEIAINRDVAEDIYVTRMARPTR